jgi:hypothetical protein
MPIANITPEVIDIDVCYGDYDGIMYKTIYIVDFFTGEVGLPTSNLETTMYIKAEHDAKMMARLWELGMTDRGEYNEITFNKIFEDVEVDEDADSDI